MAYGFQCYRPRNRREICAVYKLNAAGYPMETIAYGVTRVVAERLAKHKTALGRARRRRKR